MDVTLDDFKDLLLRDFLKSKEILALRAQLAEKQLTLEAHGSHEHEHVTPFGPPHHHPEGEPRGV